MEGTSWNCFWLYGFRLCLRAYTHKHTFENTNEQKTLYKKWERSNCMSPIIMKDSITPTIRGAIPNSDNAMTYIK